ncbi:unnamed protein product [Phytophthora lilii]|uniref:Unnamed protein product n=1 Tax=Phytophthora lilii TaxID=2077276 RepID=A0A9W6X4B9_9STRA|nr:unnamed protein product [Phytophthora lilii]
MPVVLLSGISKLLDEKGVGTGAMRKDELQSTIRELLTEAGLYQMTTVQSETYTEATGTIIYWRRDGKFHRLPENFEFPDVDAFGVCTCGSSEIHRWVILRYPPFKGLQLSDFSTKINQNRYSEWSMLVKHLRDAVKSSTERDLKPPQSQH